MVFGDDPEIIDAILDTPTQEGVGREVLETIAAWATKPVGPHEGYPSRLDTINGLVQRAFSLLPAPKPQPRGWPTREEVAEAIRARCDVAENPEGGRPFYCQPAELTDAILSLFPPCETAGGEVERDDPGAGEPVVWRWRLAADVEHPSTSWAYGDKPSVVGRPDWDVQPLYTTHSPASTSSGDGRALAQFRAIFGDAADQRIGISLNAKDTIAVATLLRRAAPGAPERWRELSPDEQFALATRIAANVGYELTPEPPLSALTSSSANPGGEEQ